MSDLSTLTQFFGWCTVINIILLGFSAILLMAFNQPIKRLHSHLLHIEPNQLDRLYFQFLANYKILNLIFCLVPYCALKIIA